MTEVARLQAALREDYAAVREVEKKYPDGDLHGPDAEADYATIQTLNASIEQKSADLAGLMERNAALQTAAQGARNFDLGGANTPVLPGPTGQQPPARKERKSFGQLFVESEQYQSALAGGAFNSSLPAELKGIQFDLSLLNQLEGKAAGELIYTGRTGFGAESDEPFPSTRRNAGFIPLLYEERTFTGLFPRTSISEEIIEFVREKTFNNNAAMIGEATAVDGTSGIKPQSDFDFEVDSTTVKDLAHWMAITNKQLRQSNLRNLIDERLGLGLDIVVEDQLLNGDGTGNNLLGLLASGIQEKAKGSDNIFDAIHRCLTAVRVTGLGRVDFIAMHPEDWETVRLTRENAATGTLGGYLFGPPSAGVSPQLWGIPVTLTTQIDKGTALVGDSRQAQIMDRERTGVRVGVIDKMFIRNLQVLLMEMALAFVVWRPASFCSVTGL